MIPSPEVVFLGRDNYIGQILNQNGIPFPNLSGVTQINLELGGTTIPSTGPASGPIQWNQPGFATGEVRLFLGMQAGLIASDTPMTAYIVTYDLTHPDGLVWGSFQILIQSGI